MNFHHTDDIGAWLAGYSAEPYRVIYSDPPWDYADKKPVGSHGGCPYPTMSDAAIMALPVARIAARDSLLFLWATMPKLQEALDVIRAWGFRYVTCGFTWVKLNPDGSIYSGMGHYTNGNAELCLLGRRGRGVTRRARDVKQIIQDRRAEHSTKPHETRRRIERLTGDVRRVELFGRVAAPGWDAVGNGLYALPDYRAGSMQIGLFEEAA